MTDSFKTLIGLRKLAVDQARYHLAAVLVLESTAGAQADEAAAQIDQEGEIAADLSTGDFAVEAFAAWLPTGQATAGKARVRHERSLLDVACARAELSAALIAAEAAEEYLKLHEKKSRALRETHMQHAADETALQRHTHTKL